MIMEVRVKVSMGYQEMVELLPHNNCPSYGYSFLATILSGVLPIEFLLNKVANAFRNFNFVL